MHVPLIPLPRHPVVSARRTHRAAADAHHDRRLDAAPGRTRKGTAP